MSQKIWVRKRLFVDRRVQGALAVRVGIYWLMCLLTIALVLLAWRIANGPAIPLYTHVRQMWFLYGPAALASLVILPLVVVDVLRLSHRFAGPMLRLRRAMRDLSQGKNVNLIQLREGDFWQDFADDFNRISAKLGAEKHPPAVPADALGTASRAAELVGAAD